MKLIFLTRWYEKKRQKFMSHISPSVNERLADPRPIEFDEFSNMWTNSYERKLIHQKLSNAAIVKVIENYAKNCSQRIPLGEIELGTTYDEVLLGDLLPILMGRFSSLLCELEQVKDELESLRDEIAER